MRKSNEKIDHDQIFKTLIKEFFLEFMSLFLPAVAEEIDFSKVEFLEQEFFTDINKGRKKLLDLVAKVRLKSGEEEFILIHTEFESRKPDSAEFPVRMFKYFCQLFLRFGKPVIPIVVFSDDRKWRKPVPDDFRIEFKGVEYLRYCYHSIKLKHLNWREFLESRNPLAYALMAKMDYDAKERVRLKADFLRLILNAERNPARESVLFEFVENYIKLTGKEQKRFDELIKLEKNYTEVMKMITVYEERGIQQGVKQGVKQGRLETARNAVFDILYLKFDTIPYQLKEKINYCDDLRKLKNALKNAVLAKSIDDFVL